MNPADCLVLAAITAAIALAFVILRQNRRAGKTGCCTDCARCAMACGRPRGAASGLRQRGAAPLETHLGPGQVCAPPEALAGAAKECVFPCLPPQAGTGKRI